MKIAHSRTLWLGFVFLLANGSLKGQHISNNTFGKELRLAAKDSSMSMKFSLGFSALNEG